MSVSAADEEARQFDLAASAAIRREYKTGGVTRRDLADARGCAPSTIGRVINRIGAYKNDPEEGENG